MFDSFVELSHYRCMVRNLVKREIRGRYKGSILGFIWNFITPLIQIIVYVMVFTAIFRSGLDYYAVYLTSGIVIWNWFSESMTEGSATIVANSEMLKKIYFPRTVLPLSIVLSKMVNFLIMMGIFFLVIAVLNYGVSLMALLYLPLAIILSLFFILGLTLILSAINVYLRDIQYIITVALMAWIWITPIMYTTKFIEDEMVKAIISVNPMTYFVEMYQNIFYWKCAPDLSDIAICALLAVASMIIGLIIFHFLERDFAEVL